MKIEDQQNSIMQYFSDFEQKLNKDFNYQLPQVVESSDNKENHVANLLALQSEAEKCDVLLEQYQTLRAEEKPQPLAQQLDQE